MTHDERKARNREKTARYRARHPELVAEQRRAQSKKWHAAHRDEALAAMRANYQKHREARRAQAKAKRLLEREKYLADRKRRYEKNRERLNDERRAKRAADPESERRKQRAWRAANLEAARRQEAEYRAHPDRRAKAVARTAAWMRAHPEHARALGRKQDAKRRADEREAFVEMVDHRVVFTRDGGVCGICKEPVDPMSRWEVDHIVPIRRGGLHAYANVQLAHRRCNRAKGAKCA